jgi:DNA modification methylase
LLYEAIEPNSIDLIVTSPPFGLITQKEYRNIDAEEYVTWFSDFGHGFWRILKDTGSLVIDIGGAWNPGRPTKSLYQFKLLLMLCEEIGFKLAQDIYWWNPARMPSPAAWVTIARTRLTDSVNCVWWLSKTDSPKANNRKVLNPYKSGQRGNIAKKLQNPDKPAYNEGPRPSGHNVSAQWAKDNRGAISHNLLAAKHEILQTDGPDLDQIETPTNLFAQANTHSQDAYRQYCRDNDLKIHPAPFPAAFPAFFIKFLTDPGDIVLDPFAGSCMTGAVASQLGRRWICCDLDEDYVRGGQFRIEHGQAIRPSRTPEPYQVYPSGLFDPDETQSTNSEHKTEARVSRPAVMQKALRLFPE